MMSIARLIAAALLVATPAAFAQLQPPDVTIRTEKVAEGIYVLFGNGGNIGLSVGDDGVFLIDDQYAPVTPRIDAAIRALKDASPRFVLNTHWHGDHTGGNENFGKMGAVIVAQDNVRLRMSVPQFMKFFGRATPASPPAALPIVTFSESVTFWFNGDEIRAFHVAPAHTDGDVVVHFVKADVIHMGDVYMRFFPFLDVDSGGSVVGAIAAVDRIVGIAGPATKIIPGHGPVANRNDLQEYRDMLAVISGRIRALLQAGKTADEIVATRPTAEYDAKWQSGFIDGEKFTRMLVNDLQRELPRK